MAREPLPTPKGQTAQIDIYKGSDLFKGLKVLPSPFSTGWNLGWVPDSVRAQMLQHPKIYQNINNLKAAIIGDGGRVIPCVHPSHPQWELARELADVCAFALRHINGSWHATARQLLDCVHEGHKVAPKTWREQNRGTYQGYWLPDTLPVWPNHVFRFLRDRAGNVPKIEVRVVGDTATSSTRSAASIPTQWKQFDREAFVVLTFRPVDGSPWGSTVCCPSYHPYYKDVQIDPEEMAMVAQFGRPTVVVVAPGPDANGRPPDDVPIVKADGTPVLDDFGQPKRLPVTRAIAQTLASYEAGSLVVLPGGSEFKLAEAQNGGELFRFIRDGNARYMASAIMGTHQVTEAERQVSTNNQAAGEGTMGLGITDGKRALEEAVENDLFRDIVRYNFGESALDYLPIYDLGAATNGRLIGLMNAVSGYINNGAFDKTQWWHYCCEVGLPLPDVDAEPVVTAARSTGGAHGNTAGENQPPAE